MKKKIQAGLLLLVVAATGLLAQTEKKHLSAKEFDLWEHLDHAQISNNGLWVSYEINPNKGDGTLFLVNSKTGEKKSFPRGMGAVFSPVNDYLVFLIKPQLEKIRLAKIAKKKKDDFPRDSLGVWDFRSGNVKIFPRVKSFKTGKKGPAVVAFLQTGPADSLKKKKEKSRLVVYSPVTGKDRIFPDVKEFTCSETGAVVGMIIQSDDTSLTTVQVCRFKDTDPVKIFSQKGKAEKLTLNKEGNKLAFLFSKDTIKIKQFALYQGDAKEGSVKLVAIHARGGVPVHWAPSVNGKIYFSEKGSRLFFGTAPVPDPEVKDTLPEDEKIDIEVWNWKDPLLQPQQKLQLNREKKRTYLSVYDIKGNNVFQLADQQVPSVTPSGKGEGRYFLGSSRLPYRKLISWESPGYVDYYLVDALTGERRKMLTKKQGPASLSPSGKYLIWYENEDSLWYVRRVPDGPVHALSKGLKVAFYDELHDTPNDPDPYGLAGWTSDEKRVWIYDRYDIWSFDPEGKSAPQNKTARAGRKNRVQYRYLDMDRDNPYIPDKQPVFVSFFNEKNKDSGFSRLALKQGVEPHKLLGGSYRYTYQAKAKNAGRVLWTKESYRIFPDLWMGDMDFQKSNKLSAANLFQSEYSWGSAELIHYPDANGKETQGLLMKPDNFDPNVKYPMLVYFYDRQADELNKYHGHYAHRSVIVPTLYTSNGYLVFMPDISYRTGYPGEDCLNSVVPGTQALIQKGYVDKNKIGVMGQSWGGYQVAYLITQTDIFSACVSGAPVSDMISAYGGIRWGSGMSRMMQYEQGQSRIGGTLWEKPLQYIWNSSVYFADKITTPLLIRHDDKDGAVPWYQGIEYFVALRRLNKPVWMLNYTGGDHLLAKWSRKKDFAIRMKQFFDHYLKGIPAPEWMEKGIPALEKGKTLGY